jgi:heme exporter protein C
MLRIPRIPILISAIALTVAGLYASLVWVGVPSDPLFDESYRVFYFHVPAAWVAYLAFGLSLASSGLFLKTRRYKFDVFAEVTAILGVIYASLTLILGSIWANVAWGIYWNWDPRETTTLVLWIAYVGYLALRSSMENVEKKAVLPSIYNILAFSTIPLSYLSVRYWQTLHPVIIGSSGGFIDSTMLGVLLLNLLAASFVFLFILIILYDLRKSERIISEYEEMKWR